FLVPEEGRIGIQVTAQIPRQLSLDMRDQPKRNALFEIWVDDFIFLSLLPSGDDSLAGVIVHQHAAALLLDKPLAADLPRSEERQRQAISKHRAQFFHQVKRQRRAPRSIGM